MSIIDFKEIPEAHIANGQQDSFELFARDFLEYMGYKIIVDPSRGADGGKDLIVEEARTGVGGISIIKWLVSCKHKAHSGISVTLDDEKDISDRVRANHCEGFIGFYSTLSSSGLSSKLENMKQEFDYQIYDCKKIEKHLIGSLEGTTLAKRYFPISINNWNKEKPQPAKIFTEDVEINCENCGKNLLGYDIKGIITFWKSYKNPETYEGPVVENIYFSCKGYCDRQLEAKYRMKYKYDGWEGIPDVMIPTIYLKWIMSIIGSLETKEEYSSEAINKMREFMFAVFPFVSRQLTSNEEERIKNLLMLPSYMGGLGNDV